MWITTFIHRQRYRQAALKNMRRLSDRELHDIGIDRRDITALVDREMSRMRTDEFRSRF
ncbi:DUF1127 domain-containing protein [Mesorhizobium sp. NBSH29]|nr:DUF1127 domain-containing protein [Mesorhizobium sp. NBSH29]